MNAFSFEDSYRATGGFPVLSLSFRAATGGCAGPEKYEGAAYHDIAAALNVAVSSAAALEFVRRLALAAITGNGDMHLKNWSLIYRGAGDKPQLAPVYDVPRRLPRSSSVP